MSLGSQENPDTESESLGPQKDSDGHGTKKYLTLVLGKDLKVEKLIPFDY